MKKATFQLETLTCPSCSMKITKAVSALEGVDPDSVNVSFNTSKVKLNFDEERLSTEAIQDSITRLGYDVLSAKAV